MPARGAALLLLFFLLLSFLLFLLLSLFLFLLKTFRGFLLVLNLFLGFDFRGLVHSGNVDPNDLFALVDLFHGINVHLVCNHN